MKKNKPETPNSIQKRVAREKFYSKLSNQRKMLGKETKDLRILDALKQGFNEDIDFELSEVDQRALEKHNSFMENEVSSKINSVNSDIRLTAAIARGK